MALSDQLNGKTEQHLIDDGVFINALVGKLAAGAGATGIYTKKGVDDELAKKADTAALADKTDKNYVDTELGKKANTADVYTKTAADTAFAKINASNLTEAVNKKAFAKAILPAKDGDKSILVDKLGEFLDNSTNNKYGAKSDQTAKVFLGGKGLKGDQGNTGPKGEKGDTGLKGADGTSPSAAEIAAQPVLQAHVAKINIESPELKKAVQEEMSQPSFDIPTSDDAALNWTW
ncbi:collagen-like protein [Wolbachia endosymbiont (group A) of Ennomos erosarius]|uniref:collagen-like triple helix repeat-containing protein n=1 Tax=Wolbachia endosymbiont (group A) of Ennomos erosarius TaxID=3066174 RepID=UPI003340E635